MFRGQQRGGPPRRGGGPPQRGGGPPQRGGGPPQRGGGPPQRGGFKSHPNFPSGEWMGPRAGGTRNVDPRNERNLGRAMEQATNLLSELKGPRLNGRDPRNRSALNQRDRSKDRFESRNTWDGPPPPPPPGGYNEENMFYDDDYNASYTHDDVYDSVYNQPHGADGRHEGFHGPQGFQGGHMPGQEEWDIRHPHGSENHWRSASGSERDRRSSSGDRRSRSSGGPFDDRTRNPQIDYDHLPPPPPPPAKMPSNMIRMLQNAPPPLPPPTPPEELLIIGDKPPPPTPEVEHCQSRQPILQTGSCALYAPRESDETIQVMNKPLGCRTIYLGNLPALVDEKMIHDIFNGCGSIENIDMSISKAKSVRTMKYCYLKFRKRESSDKAIYYNGHYLFVGNRGAPMLAHMVSKIQVDYATDRYDTKEYENDPGPDHESFVAFSENQASRVMSYLHEPERFVNASKVVIKWCKKGDMTRSNLNTFFALITTAHNFLKKLTARNDELKELIERNKQEEKDKRQPLAEQCSAIKDVFAACKIRKVWDTFTKHQRKSIQQYEENVDKEVEKINESLRLRHVPLHEVSDGEADMDLDSDPPVPGETAEQTQILVAEAAETVNVVPESTGEVNSVVTTLTAENTKLQSQVAFLKAVAEQNSGLMIQLNKTQRDLESHENEMRTAVFERDDQIVRLKLALQGLQQYFFYQPHSGSDFAKFDPHQLPIPEEPSLEPYDQRSNPFKTFGNSMKLEQESEKTEDNFDVEVMDGEIEEIEMNLDGDSEMDKNAEDNITYSTAVEGTEEIIQEEQVIEEVSNVEDTIQEEDMGDRSQMLDETGKEQGEDTEKRVEDNTQDDATDKTSEEADHKMEAEVIIVEDKTAGDEIAVDETGEVQIVEDQTAEVQIVEDQTAEVQIVEDQTAEVQIVEDQTAEVQIVEDQTAEVQIVEDQTTEEKTVQETTEKVKVDSEVIKIISTRSGRSASRGRGRKRKTPSRRSKTTVVEKVDVEEVELVEEIETKKVKLTDKKEDLEGKEDSPLTESQDLSQSTDSQDLSQSNKEEPLVDTMVSKEDHGDVAEETKEAPAVEDMVMSDEEVEVAKDDVEKNTDLTEKSEETQPDKMQTNKQTNSDQEIIDLTPEDSSETRDICQKDETESSNALDPTLPVDLPSASDEQIDETVSNVTEKPIASSSTPVVRLSKKQFSLIPVLALVLTSYPQGASLEDLKAYCDSNEFKLSNDEIRQVLQKSRNLFASSVIGDLERWYFFGFNSLK